MFCVVHLLTCIFALHDAQVISQKKMKTKTTKKPKTNKKHPTFVYIHIFHIYRGLKLRA